MANIKLKNEDKCTRIGRDIINLLGLHYNADGKYDTSWGDKHPMGLYLTIKRVIEEGEEREGLK